MSDEELMRFCAANDALRVERDANGELIVMTPAGGRTGKKHTDVIIDLGVWNRQHDRGIVFESNTGFILPDGSMLSPDAGWIERRRWEALSDRDQERFMPLCPDFVIELRSPSDSLNVLKEKMEQWIANGAQLAWLIDPIDQEVSIYRAGESPEVHHHPTSVYGDGVMAGFEMVMARIWD
ncbi:MAG TPA: Uma2 family endonuclease [Edaphobacter sp.]